MKETFVKCELCNKNLIKRKENGIWVFAYGSSVVEEGKRAPSPVVIEIHGSLRMRCLDKRCRKEHPNHWNVLNYFPMSIVLQSVNPKTDNQPIAENTPQVK